MVLQEPAQTYHTGFPSELTQPVLEYIRLGAAVDQPAIPKADNPEPCHVAGFQIIQRLSVVLSGGRAEYQIQTDPGETCILQYTNSAGITDQAQDTETITADSQGDCR